MTNWIGVPLFLATALFVLGACATKSTDNRVREWRAILAEEAPIGAPATAVEEALARRDITPSRGTYVTVGDDGLRRSHCHDHRSAITGREYADRIGFNSNVIEITACLDRDGNVMSHFVGVWIQ